jgi:4-hydroxybenzoate polyprenyltransferase
MAYKDVLSNLIALMRIPEWLHKFQELFIASLILLLFLPDCAHSVSGINAEVLLIFWIYQCFLLCYGYVINSYADREQDAIAGKHPEVSFFSTWQLQLVLGFLAVFALGVPLYYGDFRIRMLGLVTFLVATFYSLKPIRFKERGFIGILAATAFQRPLLFMFFPLIIPSCDLTLFLILLGCLFFIGLTIEINHQLADYNNDIKSGVVTWTTKVGKTKVKKWLLFTTTLFSFFICMPIFIFPIYNGLAISFALLAFSGNTILYLKIALRIT